VNIILSPIFVIILGGGLIGVGLASAVAEWAGFGAGLYLMIREVKKRGNWKTEAFARKTLFDGQALLKLGWANGNIFIRTMALTIGFNFFGNAAATEGKTFLAGYHVLMQMVTMAALVLDGFAHTAEAVAGSAYGAKNKERFNRAVRLTSEFSIGFALLLSAIIYTGGPYLINVLTNDPNVIESALTYLPYCALMPLFGFAAFQLDGIFIGTTRTGSMAIAGIAAVILYLCAHYFIYPRLGAPGIWIAFLIYYVLRALTLAMAYPAIIRQLNKDL